MKKTLVALAVLAASGAAMAQSSVTLYGIVDAYVGSTKDTTGASGNTAKSATAVSQTKVESGGLKSNRWGMRGSEDLGGGLKASFKLEQRFKSDTGEQDGVAFKGESSVSLSGGFGAVTLGRTATPFDDLRGKTNPIGDTSMSPVGDAIKEARGDYTDKVDNAIVYASPSFSGFSAAVGVSLGENKTNTVSATQHTSIKVQYANGPLLVGYGYQKEELQTPVAPATAVGINDVTYNLVAGAYDFGMAKVVGGYQTADRKTLNVKTGEDKSYYFGVSAPVAANANVYFGYVNSEFDAVAAGGDVKATGYTLAANYFLSKRTDLYVSYKKIDKENDNTGVDLGEISVFAVGVRHAF